MNDNEKNEKETKAAEKKSDKAKKALSWIIYVWSIVLFFVMALCFLGMIVLYCAKCAEYTWTYTDVVSALLLFLP